MKKISSGLLLALFLTACGNEQPNDLGNIVPDNAHGDYTTLWKKFSTALSHDRPKKADMSYALKLGFLDCNEDSFLQREKSRPLGRFDSDQGQVRQQQMCEDLSQLDHIALTDGKNIRSAMRTFQNNFVASSHYRNYESTLLEGALKKIVQNPRFKSNLAQWKPQSDYKNRDDAIEQYKIRQESMQLIADELRSAFGFKPIPVELVVVPDHFPIGGFHSPELGKIVINYNSEGDRTHSLAKVLPLLFEEVKHSIDRDMMWALINGDMKSSDIRAEHATAVLANKENYIGQLPFSLLHPYDTILSYLDYHDQYIEESAKAFAEYAAKRLNNLSKEGKQTLFPPVS